MIKFYNTLTRKLDEFVPYEDNIVRIYSCGPTVYDYAHIGNFRSYVFSDLLRRFLKYKGYKVIHVMNITDVDDKTIRNSKEKNMSLKEYTEKYTDEFFKDLETLNIEKVEYYPRATEHINDMIELIKKLDKNGYIYESNGSIYYKISKFKNYGKLSKLDLSKAKDGARVDVDEYNKEDVKDFVLWKAKKEDEPFWETPYGEGRPGWHIECSTMSMKYLGETLDIHTGGVDLIFPHHENEIAQSEGATGKTFVRYWLHCEHLIVEGEKMSKSKGNFYTLRDILSQGFSPMAIRYLLLSVHYRKQLNFTKESLNGAEQAVDRIHSFYNSIKQLKTTKDKTNIKDKLKPHLEEFDKNMEDDLNIAAALGNLFDFIHTTNKFIEKHKISHEDKTFILESLKKIDSILGILKEDDYIDDKIKEMIEKRQEARKNKDYKTADEIRDILSKMGIIIEDTADGIRWRKK